MNSRNQTINKCVKELLPEHRDHAWRTRFGRVWSWDVDRQQWLDESRGEADRDAWHSQESVSRLARIDSPYTAVS